MVCSVEGCGGRTHAYGLCSKHYQRAYLYGRLGRKSDDADTEISLPRRARDGRQSSPLYNLWFERKQQGTLCEAWNSFVIFELAVGKRPKNCYLARLDSELPYGPDNFEWREHLKQKPEETKKEWHARKWQSRRKHHPNYEADRWMRRKYGVTRAQYNSMLLAQNSVCAICRQSETTFDNKTHGFRSLSVDHCHKTKVVRGLLCFRCNSVIGRVNDSIELLDACKAYLLKSGSFCPIK